MRVTKTKIYWCSVGGTALAGAGIVAALFLISPQDGRSRMSARGLSGGRSGSGSLSAGSTARGKVQKGQRGGVTLSAGRGDLAAAASLRGANADELGAGNLGEGRTGSDGKKHRHGTGRDGDAKGKGAKGEHRRLTSDELAKIREALQRPEAGIRLGALRLARNYDTAEIEPDIRAMLGHETNVPVKRVAAQILALGDAQSNLQTLEDLRQDKDGVVRVNSALGIARTGDDAQQAWLLSVYDASRQVAPHLVPVLSAALEAPDLKAPALIARYESVANDPNTAPAVRARATAIVQAKLAPTAPATPH